ncbi:MAG: O-antigen ligase family protein [Patescibacteria group bacterium]|nr:O-antigen ligase family protein [Patescibacteria group bacterium]MCL6096510.1 O-antigen ligase family protein [Patescibacteria group bacterium]
MKIFNFISENILFILALFLLAFIPLYPKIPVIGIAHTWVYIRLEDFLVAVTVVIWIFQIVRKKATFKTPLTIPIILFWLVGGISTAFAVFFIFPHIPNVFPNVALFNYLRRIEYLMLFFIGFSSIRNKSHAPYITGVLAITLLIVVGYGVGQRLFGFPAFLTGNEEFAKGIPLRISALGRIPSTFAGHYDLAAYLVFTIAILGSMIFGFKNIVIKFFLLFAAFSGLILLLMTASRVSFMVYLVSIAFMLMLQKKKYLIIPVVIISLVCLNSFEGISNRFGSTISQVDVVVDARTGKPIGIAKKSLSEKKEKKPILIEETQSTGENLGQGTGYLNFPVVPTTKTITQVIYKRSRIVAGTESAVITNIQGDFAVKKALAYDVSFTTRFQGEWPRAIEALERNPILGSGYSSISLATDNNYLRILGEIGILGLASFLLLFFMMGIYIYRLLPDVQSPISRSFILGIVSGLFGLGLNAILIDVFEASKVAFVMWLILGLGLGLIHLEKKHTIDYLKELKNALLSVPAVLIYLFIITFALFLASINNYFVGDDFTWLRWIADCKKVLYSNGLMQCQSISHTVIDYFTRADGFFYRPLAKLYFFVMYAVFWLNQAPYHLFSIFLHFLNVGLVFILSLRFLKSKLFAFVVSLFFLSVSSHSEAILWISSTGHLFASFFILLSLVFYIFWKEKNKIIFLALSVISVFLSPLFQEAGVIAPLFIFAYDLFLVKRKKFNKFSSRLVYYLYVIPIAVYFVFRQLAASLGPSGDYSYSFVHLPYNFVGNTLGYFSLTIFGTKILPFYASLRDYGKNHLQTALVILVILILLSLFFYKTIRRKIDKDSLSIVYLGSLFFLIALLPFLGLGNIAVRYSYLSSFGLLLIFAFILQKFYYNFSLNKKLKAILLLLIILGFSAFHVFELQRINNDWRAAGNITQRLLVNFNDRFQNKKATPQNPVFYFTDVPIRHGEAWVFPVGLKDALWFTFQNENLTVHTMKSLDLAFAAAEGSTSARIFQFDKKGDVEEVIKTINTITIPIK